MNSQSMNKRNPLINLVLMICLALLVVWAVQSVMSVNFLNRDPVSSFLPDLGFEVGVMIDESSIFTDDVLYLVEGAAPYPIFRIEHFDASEVDEVKYWLDEIEVADGQPLDNLKVRKEPYVLEAEGVSEMHNWIFGYYLTFYVVEQNEDDDRKWFVIDPKVNKLHETFSLN